MELRLSCTNPSIYSSHESPFYPAALKGSRVLSSPERAGGRQGRHALLTLSRPQFVMDHFQTWQGHSLPWDLGQVRLWRFCLIKYAHYRPFNEPASFDLPELSFQAKVTKCCTYVVLNMLINISSGFCHNRQQKKWRSHVSKFSRIIFKLGKDIHSPKFAVEFNYGGSA